MNRSSTKLIAAEDGRPGPAPEYIVRHALELACGDLRFAIDVSDVRCLAQTTVLAPLQNSPVYIIGVVTAAGRNLPLIDVRAKFELPIASGLCSQRCAIVSGRLGEAAVAFDTAIGIATVRQCRKDAGQSAQYLTPFIAAAERPIGVLNVDRLLAEMSEYRTRCALRALKADRSERRRRAA